MKVNNFLPKTARKALFCTAMMALFAGATMLTSCKKDNVSQAEITDLNGTETGSKKVNSANLVGTGGDNGYFYQNTFGGGTATMSSNSNPGNFDVTWNNVTDGVWGKGWCTRSNFYNGWPLNYATSVPENRKVGYNLGSISGDADFFGVYGWTQGVTSSDEPIEFYVVEKGPGFGGTGSTTISVDGHTYTVKTARRPPGAHTPFGASTTGFDQYFDRWGGQTTGVNAQVDMALILPTGKANSQNGVTCI